MNKKYIAALSVALALVLSVTIPLLARGAYDADDAESYASYEVYSYAQSTVEANPIRRDPITRSYSSDGHVQFQSISEFSIYDIFYYFPDEPGLQERINGDSLSVDDPLFSQMYTLSECGYYLIPCSYFAVTSTEMYSDFSISGIHFPDEPALEVQLNVDSCSVDVPLFSREFTRDEYGNLVFACSYFAATLIEMVCDDGYIILVSTMSDCVNCITDSGYLCIEALSCEQELWVAAWRTYPISEPVPTFITVSSRTSRCSFSGRIPLVNTSIIGNGNQVHVDYAGFIPHIACLSIAR